jgi:predicted PurR-regulated permease PerM
MFPRLVSLAVLLTLIVLVGSAFYQVVVPFLLPLFLAAVLAVVSQPLQRYFLKKSGGRAAWAAGLTTLALMAMLVVPLAVGTFIAAVQLRDVADQSLGRDWRDGLDLLWSRLVALDLEWLSP